MKYRFIEAPICKGSPTTGSEFAFRALKKDGRLNGIDTAFIEYKKPSVLFPAVNDDRMRHYNEVMPVSAFVCDSVFSCLKDGEIPVTIGGDHSVAMGSIAGMSKAFSHEGFSVLYIDGHTDINNEKTTESGFIHGMPLASALGICDDCLTVGDKINLLGKNTFIFGARSIDKGEYKNVEKTGAVLYTRDDIVSKGIKTSIAEVLNKIKTERIHVSFDVDFMDGKEFPATGYKMKNGFSFEDAKEILSEIKKDGRAVSFDFVEYNPTVDDDGKCMDMLVELIKAIK